MLDVQASQIGFIGIAVALLGRNTAIGTCFAALLFGGLLYGTSTRGLNPNVFDPELAGNLTLDHPGAVVLFVGADVLHPLRLERRGRSCARADADRGGMARVTNHAQPLRGTHWALRPDGGRDRRHRRSGSLAFWSAMPPVRRRARRSCRS